MSNNNKAFLRIGAGAGYSGDRIEPAVELAQKGDLHYLVFECLAERTIALAQQEKQKNPDAGFDPLLEDRMEACLALCHEKGIKIITNMGAANPTGAMKKTAEVAGRLGLKNLKIAAVTGDDVLDRLDAQHFQLLETGKSLSTIRDKVISANAYLGAEGIVAALEAGADVVITGRVADPALFLAPLVFEFGWAMDDYHMMGKGVLLGHLLECAGQVTGGYFADRWYKDVPMLSTLGFPIAEVRNDGSFFITKVPGSGGMVTLATCKEQLLYEIHDPACYYTPDVIADFSNVNFFEIEKDKIGVEGGTGRTKTGKFKVSVGYRDSFIGEGQISYGSKGSVERAGMALDIVKDRLQIIGIKPLESRFDIIGLNSLYRDSISYGVPYEVRARVAVRTDNLKDALKVGNEVEALYTNGPAGGGGVTKSAREVIAVKSILMDSHLITPQIHYLTL